MAEDEQDDIEGAPPPQQTEDRSAELKDKLGVTKRCLEIYKTVERGFQDQWERGNSQMDYWDIYNCQLGPNQFYSGNSKIFAPIVHDAVNARKTRFVNQIFPQSGKHIEVSASEDKPQAIMSLLEFYILVDIEARLRDTSLVLEFGRTVLGLLRSKYVLLVYIVFFVGH